MCKDSLGILNYNEIIAGALGWGDGFWFEIFCVCVRPTNPNALTPSWRPWKVCVESFGWE